MRHLAHHDSGSNSASKGADNMTAGNAKNSEEEYGDDKQLAPERVSELAREEHLVSDAEIDADRAAEKAVQAAAEPPPRMEHRFPGEINGTLSAEDEMSHEHKRAGLPN